MATKERRGKSRAGVHAHANQMATEFRRKLESSPTVATTNVSELLPKVDSISLDDLVVEVVPPQNPSDDTIQLMLRALMRETASRRTRKDGEKIEEGDEILIDMLGYRDGKIMPFVGRQDHFVIADSFFDAEGLGMGLIGQDVGATAVVDAELPQDFAEESLQGFAYKAAIVIRGAVEVTERENAAEELLTALEVEDIGAASQKIRAHAYEQAKTAVEMNTQSQALHILFERSGAEIPLEATQEEVREQWRKSEGSLLARQSISQKDMEFSLETWLATPRILATAESSLRGRVVLDTVARTHAIVATQEEVSAAITQIEESMGGGEEMPQAMRDSMSGSVRDLKTLAYIAGKTTSKDAVSTSNASTS